MRRLIDGHHAALALIIAPAGYGKSTLLAEWAAHDERPFIWIKLGRHDQDASGIVASLAQAFEEMGWIDAAIRRALAAPKATGRASILARLLPSLERSGRRFVLVLDDAHVAPPSLLNGLVSGLLDQVGQGSQIALASRTEPTLPIGRLRAHRALVEIRTDDLTMVPAEAATLLRLAGLELEFGAVQTLVRRSEGWPVGLYLAALSLRDQSDAAPAVRNFGGENHLVAEYFRDEFLAGLSPRLISFVLRTSVLEKLSGPLCDAVLDQTGSGRTLAALARRNLMLLPVDEEHQWFRWHGLFGPMLQAELRRAHPEVEPGLHARASAWLGHHRDLDGAIGHAVGAADARRAGDLLWANIGRYTGSARTATVQRWLRGFSFDQIARHAPLALSAAHCALITGDVDQARHWALVAGEASRASRSTSSAPSLEAGIAIVDAAAARSGTTEMAERATLAYELEPDHSQLRPICCWLMGTAQHLAGRRAEAAEKLEEGVQCSGAAAPSIASLCLAQLAWMAIEQNDWEAAVDFAERAAEALDRDPPLAASPISALVFAACAATRSHQGRVDESKRDLRHAADLLASFGDLLPWYGAETRIMMARAALGLADTVRVRTLLAEASRSARKVRGAVIFEPCFDQAWAEIDTLAETALSGPSSLTIAELRILRFLPSHRSFREIAERLGVSVNTVKTQAHAIYRKLDAASRSEAVARAASAGLLGS